VYYASEIFTGPSLFFHEKALAAARVGPFDRFAEYAYAVLASWGMHRMGANGPKMCAFDAFHSSLRPFWPVVQELRRIGPDQLDSLAWDRVELLFRGLRCMATGTSLVGNSKVLAHALPNLIAPIDREYTLQFLLGRKNLKNDLDREWDLFRQIHEEFYHPLLDVQELSAAIQAWITQKEKYPWDTSPLKTIDNLVIGCVRKARRNDK